MAFDNPFPHSSYSGTHDLRGNAQEPLLTPDHGLQVTYTIGAEATNVINVAMQFTDSAGHDIAYPVTVQQYLSDAATGIGLGTAHTSAPAIGTDGAILEFTTASLIWLAQSEVDGDLDIDFTDTGAGTVYLVTVLPSGAMAVSGAITHA